MLTTISSHNEQQEKKVPLGTLLLLLTLIGLMTAIFVAIYNQKVSHEAAVATESEVHTSTYEDSPSFLYSIYGNPASPLRAPMGVYADERGRIYVASTNSHQIQVFNQAGKFAYSFGNQGSLPGQFSFPYGIAGMDNGNLLIAETGNRRIQEFSPQGKYIGLRAGKGSAVKVEKPGPLTISGNVLYLGDLTLQQVKKLNLKTGEQHVLAEQFYPHGVDLDSKGNVYVANAGNYTVNVFSAQGKLTGTVPAAGADPAFSLLRGLAVDKLDRIYAVDAMTCQVKVFSPKGKLLFTFGRKGFGDGELFYPTGIFVDGKNRIYVADWGNNRVCVWSYEGK